jgi:tape measure domain-containing protein
VEKMAVAGTLTYDTKLDTKDYQKGLNQISATTIAKGTLMADAFKLVASKLIEVVKGGITYNATIEQLATSFEVMTGSADEATKLVEKLKILGSSTPYELTGLASTVQTLMQYGLTADEAYDATINFGDIAQGSAEKMQSIALAFGQMSSAGKVNMQDIKQMINAGWNPLQTIAEMTGKTMAQVTAEYEKGKISVEDVTKAMAYASSENGKYYQSMEKQSQTLNGQLSTLKDIWNSLTGDISKGVTDVLTNKVLPVLNELLSGTGKYNDVLVILGITIGTVTALILAYNIQQALATAGLTLWGAICGFATAVTTALGIAFAFLVSPIGLIIIAIGLVIAIGYLLIKHWDTVKTFAVKVFTAIKDFFVDVFTVKIPNAINKVIEWFKKIPSYIGFMIGFVIGLIAKLFIGLWNFATIDIPKFIGKVIEWFKELPSKIWNAIIGVKDKIVQFASNLITTAKTEIPKVISKITEFFKELPGNMLSVGKNIVEGLWDGIKNATTWIKDKVKQFAQGILDGMKAALGVKSPSTKARDIAKYIPQGMAVGIEADTSKALSAIDDMNDDILNKMKQAVNIETSKSSFSGTSGSVSQILTANGTTTVNLNNETYLDGEKVYENQKTVSAKKNLQYQFA